MAANDVPDDFPRDNSTAVVSGAGPKLCVRLVDGIYTAALSNEERRERWIICESLTRQLATVAKKDARAHPEHSTEQTVERVKSAVCAQRWLSSDELEWVGRRLLFLLIS
ncbi:hypothetical protein [Paraburkholderia sp. J67]|uniref:hypothetical protein n=1 Tax=Paraburkholderia sp. J67 TaxID=2805435 RepID=UPI002ABD2406|nr:hypothetical protein [Paraburkholderia sp. J67]